MDEKLIQRLESAVARLESLSLPSQSRSIDVDAVAASTDPSIIAFEDLLTEFVGKVLSAAEKIGGQVKEVTDVLHEAFSVQKELLVKIKHTKKPDMVGLGEFLKPLNDKLMKAISLTEGRRSDFFNHQKAVAESLTALAWIAYVGKDCGMSMPIAHVEESWQAAEFYNNKVLVEYRNKDSNHVEWARALKELYVPGLRNYVKTHYPLGPVWSATGSAVSAPPKAPAPPPPPPASLFSSEPSQPSSSRPKEGMAAVFQEISSKPVTAGLKKVTDDMKTKNRADRAGFVSASEKEVRTSVPSASKVGPPKLELQMGRKWVVENQIGKKDLLIDKCDSKQTVYIFGCKDSVLQIKGKVNNITVDKCTKMGVVFTDVVAACEIVNCNSVEVQCQGTAPTISVDNSAGCQLYLSKDSLEASITTAKSSEINVLVPASGPDNDLVEHALPQQYIHTYKDGQFVTTPVSHSGG
ncbi:putative cyclase-associated protein CAP/septum formation inhibitor MinC [Helianthus annuus]|uniref:Adenylyl cyclase-associated protein n=1 Tax=Helianthus annuus TaxID=4232 RepID=A0A251SUP2_HELAN|nr:cyclase-associated protein 1 [Helianthus annuus]KAF5778433.1 putative cyclase-associated protein CAP/septum formation inhibitor MinC [Helianthus annuus]KAJ0489838.1 putative cyclase-associated protein CAP/septum formation inhibitor MinC [Helianthus annuus]KAJ0505751.1 putative cyclase-associated protein CAP/septum formation inhibitor MinC [Helianthus annuus]KAJ0675419.1 putative cyclase-associated protein CAP/septum formation inhibitor MinC [Helianthus annuus]KAJ0678714.1 putative cyclase-a